LICCIILLLLITIDWCHSLVSRSLLRTSHPKIKQQLIIIFVHSSIFSSLISFSFLSTSFETYRFFSITINPKKKKTWNYLLQLDANDSNPMQPIATILYTFVATIICKIICCYLYLNA
jgi:hypothetical protein